jgi:hypothetical protein
MHNHKLGWYRILLKLYPKAYRQEYEEEMLTTLQEMFAGAESRTAKRRLFVRISKDYILSLLQQNVWATTQSFNEAPRYAKRNLSISTFLVMPFSVIFLYNIMSLYFRHVVRFSNLEARTWVIYSIVLPLFALILLAQTCFSSVYAQLMRRSWREAVRTIFQGWLFLSMTVVGLVALVAIF